MAHPDIARRMVATIVEAESIINDPAQIDRVTDIAAHSMQGIDPAALRLYIEKYRQIYAPVATPTAIANVGEYLRLAHVITQAPAYDRVVATEFMPKAAATASAR